MVRKSLLVATLVAIASPVAAQDTYTWTTARPDGQAPIGVFGDRTLPRAAVEVTYRFSQLNSKGVWFSNDSLRLEETLEFYDVAPLRLSNQSHQFSVSVGATDNVTFLLRGDYSSRQREQLTNDGLFYVTESQELGDLELDALYQFMETGPYRAHFQLGAILPTGGDDVTAETPFSSPGQERLPYDMRPGGGTFGVVPGATVQVQNEVASVGAQMRAVITFGTNNLDYSPGNVFEGTGWAAYKINDQFSLSARIHWQHWGGIEGGDPELDIFQDPGNDGFFLGGERVDLPIGVNFMFPAGGSLEGHRISFEAVFPTHHEYQGPQLGLDWGVVLGWQVVF